VNRIEITYKYRGYTYEPYEDEEHDESGRVENSKITHRVRGPNDDLMFIRHDPYYYLTAAQFIEWVRRGKITDQKGSFVA